MSLYAWGLFYHIPCGPFICQILVHPGAPNSQLTTPILVGSAPTNPGWAGWQVDVSPIAPNPNWNKSPFLDSAESSRTGIEQGLLDHLASYARGAIKTMLAGALISGLIPLWFARRAEGRKVVGLLFGALPLRMVPRGSRQAVWRRRSYVLALLAPIAWASISLGGLVTGYDKTALERFRIDAAFQEARQLMQPGKFEQLRADAAAITQPVKSDYPVTGGPPPGCEAGCIKVLHLSDVHWLFPSVLDLLKYLSNYGSFDIVVDTGDLNSTLHDDFQGAHEEDLANFAVEFAGSFDAPYVYVRGNHDPTSFVNSLVADPNVVVLDGNAVTIDGLTIYGKGDPVTPGEISHISQAEFEAKQVKVAPLICHQVEGLTAPPDIVLVHDKIMAENLVGRVPLVLSGHVHVQSAAYTSGTWFLVDGSSGGKGIGHRLHQPPEAEVLWFQQAAPHRLVAYETAILSGSSSSTGHLNRAKGDLKYAGTACPPAQ